MPCSQASDGVGADEEALNGGPRGGVRGSRTLESRLSARSRLQGKNSLLLPPIGWPAVALIVGITKGATEYASHVRRTSDVSVERNDRNFLTFRAKIGFDTYEALGRVSVHFRLVRQASSALSGSSSYSFPKPIAMRPNLRAICATAGPSVALDARCR